MRLMEIPIAFPNYQGSQGCGNWPLRHMLGLRLCIEVSHSECNRCNRAFREQSINCDCKRVSGGSMCVWIANISIYGQCSKLIVNFISYSNSIYWGCVSKKRLYTGVFFFFFQN